MIQFILGIIFGAAGAAIVLVIKYNKQIFNFIKEFLSKFKK